MWPLFFLAFPPQFVHPESGPAVIQFAVLGLVFVMSGAAYTSLIALGAGPLGQWLARHRSIGRWQGRVVGGVYLGLGVKLALLQLYDQNFGMMSKSWAVASLVRKYRGIATRATTWGRPYASSPKQRVRRAPPASTICPRLRR